MPPSAQMQLVIITGASGAGRITAVRSLEDFGFEVIDNLPLALSRQLLSLPGDGNRPLAVGIDVRTRDFSVRALEEFIAWARELEWIRTSVLFLDCAAEVLQRRYNETRRAHPFGQVDGVEGGIREEIRLLAPLRNISDHIIDTSDLSPHDLKARLQSLFDPDQDHHLTVGVESFSYKNGVPAGLDMALDCRFLRNPHWDEALRPRDGTDAGVAAFIAQDPLHDQFMDRTLGMLSFLLPAYKDEGKSYFTLGFGCTGGKHRSVYMTEQVGSALQQSGWKVAIRHRALKDQT